MLPYSSLRSIALVAIAGLLLGVIALPARAQPPILEKPFAPRPLSRIEPGAVITDRAPQGWSQLVVKSQPKIAAGDIAKVPEMTVKFIRMFFTAIVLKVELRPGSQPRQYRLASAAIGIGTRAGDKDTIVSSDTFRSQGANLGMVGGIVLSKSEEQLNQVVEVARSATMVIADAPTVLARGNAHVQVMLRYAFLVDPRDGRCYTLIWVLDKDASGGYRLGNSPLVLLPPNLVTDCEMQVDASKFFLGTPGPDAFAVLRLPPGKPLAWPTGLVSLAAERQFTPSSAHRLELGLWNVVFAPQP